MPYRCVPQAESQSISVACASIVAKVTRDRIMFIYDKIFPKYGFAKHKGYGTRAHFKKIRKHGPSILHRRTFFPVSEFFNHER
jgi:ribonuclease HII